MKSVYPPAYLLIIPLFVLLFIGFVITRKFGIRVLTGVIVGGVLGLVVGWVLGFVADSMIHGYMTDSFFIMAVTGGIVGGLVFAIIGGKVALLLQSRKEEQK
jgi:hypothetical protein